MGAYADKCRRCQNHLATCIRDCNAIRADPAADCVFMLRDTEYIASGDPNQCPCLKRCDEEHKGDADASKKLGCPRFLCGDVTIWQHIRGLSNPGAYAVSHWNGAETAGHKKLQKCKEKNPNLSTHACAIRCKSSAGC